MAYSKLFLSVALLMSTSLFANEGCCPVMNQTKTECTADATCCSTDATRACTSCPATCTMPCATDASIPCECPHTKKSTSEEMPMDLMKVLEDHKIKKWVETLSSEEQVRFESVLQELSTICNKAIKDVATVIEAHPDLTEKCKAFNNLKSIKFAMNFSAE